MTSAGTGSLGRAVSAEELLPGMPYAIGDGLGRLLAIDNPGATQWSYAEYVPYDQYPNRIAPIFFSRESNGHYQISILHDVPGSITKPGKLWPIFPQNASPSCDARWGIGGQDAVDFIFDPGPERDTYNLRRVMSDGSLCYLSRTTQNPTDYAIFQLNVDPQLQFRFYPLNVVGEAGLAAIIGNVWPNLAVHLHCYRGDGGYQVLWSNQIAMRLWTESGLNPKTWTKDSFDCDDFAYVYKAQASLSALKDPNPDGTSKLKYGLAVGIVFGNPKPNAKPPYDGAHAANVFIKVDGSLMIIDYGNIIPAAEWQYDPYFILM